MHADNVRPVTKAGNQVFWRWFFVSNWSAIKVADRGTVAADIAREIGYYAPEFREKATIEIIWGNRVEVRPASAF